jgi:uncharacterized lipoprotein YehR (DUF1307 family)
MNASGMPNYPYLADQRKKLLRKAEAQRPLRRSEYIDLYGYQAWLDYCEQNGIDPHEADWADVHMHKLSSIAGPASPES